MKDMIVSRAIELGRSEVEAMRRRACRLRERAKFYDRGSEEYYFLVTHAGRIERRANLYHTNLD